MKKFIAFILAAVLLLSLMVGCGKKDASESEEAPVTEETISQDVEVPETPADVVEEEPATEDAPAVEEKPVQEEKPVAEEKPAAPEVPKEEVPAPQEPTPAPEQPKEEPAPQIPSETPILPPSSSNTTEDIPDETPTISVTKELSQIIDEIYAISDPILPAVTIPVDLTDPYSLSSFTGLTDASAISEAVASESMMGAQAYSLVLVRLKDAGDAQSVAQAMRNGIDQRKWICVLADDIRVVACDDVVMLCMIASNLDVKVDNMINAFASVMGKPFTADIT